MPLPTSTALNHPVIVLGGMLALLTLALALKLYRCAKPKFTQFFRR